MTVDIKREMQTLIDYWQARAQVLADRSSDTYEKLRTGELAQDDTIIYSVYEDDAAASVYRGCARQLMLLAKKLLAKEL